MGNFWNNFVVLGYIILSTGISLKNDGGYFENARRLKQILAVVIAMNCIMGITLIVLGMTSLLGDRLKFDFTPRGKWERQNHIVSTALGVAYFICSSFGYFGIWESKNKYTKAFMVMSISLGFGLLQSFITWVATIGVLVPKQEAHSKKEYDEYSHKYYAFLIFFSAILQLACGFLSYLISLHYISSRGYYTTTQEEADVEDFFENLKKSNALENL